MYYKSLSLVAEVKSLINLLKKSKILMMYLKLSISLKHCQIISNLMYSILFYLLDHCSKLSFMVKKIPRSSLSQYLSTSTFIIIMENNIKKLYLIRT
jgi:hypothetical protein